MKNTQFIPEKYKLSVHRNQYQKEVPRGTPFPFSSTPEVQQEIDKKLIYNSKFIDYENKPTSGFHIMADKEDIQIFHPDGYALSLSLYNIGIIIRECIINNGMIDDELIFVFDKTYREYALIPYNKETYVEVKKQSDDFYAAKKGTSELKYGCTIDYNSIKFTYLGTYYVYSISKTGFKKLHRNLLKKDDIYYLISTSRKPDAILHDFDQNIVSEDKLLDELKTKRLMQINSFYKSGSYHQEQLNYHQYYFSTKKLSLKDFDISYTTNEPNYYGQTYSIPGIPIFESDDGNLYAALNDYSRTLAYSISGYNIGQVVRALPYNIENLYTDSNSTIINKKIVKIAIPRLVKK